MDSWTLGIVDLYEFESHLSIWVLFVLLLASQEAFCVLLACQL